MTKLKFTLGAAISFYLAYITGTGDILNYITFADPLNEFALFVTSSVMGIMLTALAVSYKQENC